MNPLRAASLASAIVLLGLTALSGLVVLPSAAHAQTDDPGRIHFQAGASDYESGDYEHALGEFQRAYELSQRKQLFYNIALSYQQLGDLEHAIEFLGRYLNEVEEIPNRAALERRQANLQRRLEAQQTAATEASEREAAAAQAAAAQAAAAEAAADHAAAVQAAADHATQANGEAPATSDATPPGAETEQGASSDGDSAHAGANAEHGGGANVPAIVSFVGGGVGVAMAVAFGVMALSEKNRVSALECAETATCDDFPGANPRTMDTYALLSDVGTGLAVVGVGLGLIFLLTADDEEVDPNQARIRVAPFAGPNAAGLAAQGSF